MICSNGISTVRRGRGAKGVLSLPPTAEAKDPQTALVTTTPIVYVSYQNSSLEDVEKCCTKYRNAHLSFWWSFFPVSVTDLSMICKEMMLSTPFISSFPGGRICSNSLSCGCPKPSGPIQQTSRPRYLWSCSQHHARRLIRLVLGNKTDRRF